ncbi:MAG: hypothetical protein ABW321_03705 [Polyangiales bacterium]
MLGVTHAVQAQPAFQSALRGITIGPIESSQHPDRGYGSAASRELLDELVRLGANAVSITPFGRVWDLSSTTITPDFEWTFAQSRAGVLALAAEAHARGLRVLLIPHLWVETFGWRGEMDPGSDAGWERYQRAYRDFVLRWADVAEHADADVFSIGVECKSWSGRFGGYWTRLIGSVREHYHGQLTYSANWDEADAVLFWDQLDLIGINAFYPLADHAQASYAEYAAGAERALDRAEALHHTLDKPVLFVEIGYTTRPDAAVEPWLWPDIMHEVHVDEWEQARALAALLGATASRPWIAGAFVWRYYADLDDVSQEAGWGFSPHGKLAERVLSNAFRVPWASDPVAGAATDPAAALAPRITGE